MGKQRSFTAGLLIEFISLFLDSEPEAMPATAKRLALDGAQKKCYDAVNPMGKWSLLLSPLPSAYPNQHFFCVVSRVAFAAARLCVFFLYIMVKSYYARIEALFGMIALNWDS